MGFDESLAANRRVSSEPQSFGPFRLHELINSGGTAEIWLATNQRGEYFALRRLLNASLFNFTERRRFWRGCEVLSKIHHHECVIGYIDHGKVNGVPYLLMEYVEGENLKLLYARHDPVLGEHIGNILIDMARALEHVHDCGYIHLDFKPENVVLTRNGSLRLVDFDLAHPKPDKPKKLSERAGTPAYMAPEQLLGRPIDHRADIFAYGTTAYELLTFRKPFPGDTPKQVLSRQLNRSLDFVTPKELNPDVPAGLEKIILKCLETDPEKRYPFTSVLVRDLEATLYVKP